jgi:hypothetical protein
LQFSGFWCIVSGVTGAAGDEDDLVNHLCRSSALAAGEAQRLVSEVLAYFSETLEEFVRRRHAELRARGWRNEEIFAAIAEEVPGRRVVPRPMSRRQIRRMVYG